MESPKIKEAIMDSMKESEDYRSGFLIGVIACMEKIESMPTVAIASKRMIKQQLQELFNKEVMEHYGK